MSIAFRKNIGAFIKLVRAFINTAMLAGGAGDNTLVTGLIIDRESWHMPLSAVLGISYTTTLAEAATLTFKSLLVEHGDAANLSDAATFLTLEDATGSVIETGPTGGATVTGCKEYDIDLAGAKRYIRIKVTPDLSAADTDVAGLAGVLALEGGDTLPA